MGEKVQETVLLFALSGSLCLGGTVVKNHLPMQETQVQSLGQEDSPGGRNSNPLQYLPEKPHGQRSLVGYSLQSHIESDTTEKLSTHKPDGLKQIPGGKAGLASEMGLT